MITVYYMISVYLTANAYDKLTHMVLLVNRVTDQLYFLILLMQMCWNRASETDYLLAMRTKDDLLRDASQKPRYRVYDGTSGEI